MTDKQAKVLQKAILELTAEYEKALDGDFIFKPMSFALYHLWQKWDAKEHKRLLDGKENE